MASCHHSCQQQSLTFSNFNNQLRVQLNQLNWIETMICVYHCLNWCVYITLTRREFIACLSKSLTIMWLPIIKKLSISNSVWSLAGYILSDCIQICTCRFQWHRPPPRLSRTEQRCAGKGWRRFPSAAVLTRHTERAQHWFSRRWPRQLCLFS